MATKENILDRSERWIGIHLRYPRIYTLIVAILIGGGWILDRTWLRVPQKLQEPKINIYNAPAEKFETSLRHYFQFPPYKTLTINYGGSLKFNNYFTITPQKIGLDSYLMIQIDGEQELRAFNLSKMSLPFTIEINNKGFRGLLAIEQVKELGVQVRTFLAIQ